MITRDEIEKRHAELVKERDEMHAQVLANLNAYNGAIQECERWLNTMDEKASTPNVEPVEPQE